MYNQTTSQTQTLRLLETGELVPVHESEQQEAAQAYFRSRLLNEGLMDQRNTMDNSQIASTAVGRNKY